MIVRVFFFNIIIFHIFFIFFKHAGLEQLRGGRSNDKLKGWGGGGSNSSSQQTEVKKRFKERFWTVHTQSCTLHSSSAQKCLSCARCKFKGISFLRFEWKIPPWVLGTVEANTVHSKDFVSEGHRPTTDINNDFFFFFNISSEDVPMVEYLVVIHTPGESYHQWLRSFVKFM